MKNAIKKYLDNVFAARQAPAIAFGPFFDFLVSCVKADGGTWNEVHQYFEFPPGVAGGSLGILGKEEVFKWFKNIPA